MLVLLSKTKSEFSLNLSLMSLPGSDVSDHFFWNIE